jgi:Tetrapyrrole (Corrin/Porphyrin) Methylases
MTGEDLIYNLMMSGERAKNSKLALAVLLGAVPKFDLACVGISIRGLSACTFEAVAHIAAADIVFCYPPDPGHFRLVKMINENSVNMYDSSYKKGLPFDSTYDAIIQEVMSTLRSGKRVAYATQGSPAFHCGTAISLHRRARQEGYLSVLISGVSSLELLSTELSPEFDIRNLQVCSTLDLARGSIRIDPRSPCLLFDLSRYVLPSVRETPDKLDGSRLRAVAEMLRGIYSASHSAILMLVRANGECIRSLTSLAEFERAVAGQEAVPTVFLPASLN